MNGCRLCPKNAETYLWSGRCHHNLFYCSDELQTVLVGFGLQLEDVIGIGLLLNQRSFVHKKALLCVVQNVQHIFLLSFQSGILLLLCQQIAFYFFFGGSKILFQRSCLHFKSSNMFHQSQGRCPPSPCTSSSIRQKEHLTLKFPKHFPSVQSLFLLCVCLLHESNCLKL